MDKKVLTKAVADTEEPTPGYLYDEIAKMTFEGLKESSKLVDFLLKKLTKDSPFVLAKALRVIRMTCERGHPDFKKEMQTHVEDLRRCATFRGKPDVMNGDRLNQAVRDAAQAAIEAAFAANKEATKIHSKDLTGQGSNSIERPNAGAGFQTGMATKPQNAPTGNALQTHFHNIAHGIAPASATIYGQVRSAVSTGFGLVKESERDAMLRSYITDSHNLDQSYQAPTIALGLPTPTPVVPGLNLALAPQPVKEVTPFKMPEPVNEDNGAGTSPEADLVKSKIINCTHATPTRATLAKFVSAATGMNMQEMCIVLDDYLEEKQHWQSRLRALCAIESLLIAEIGSVKDYFQKNPEDIIKNVNVVQETVKDKAKRVLLLLDVRVPTSASVHTPPAAAPVMPPSFKLNLEAMNNTSSAAPQTARGPATSSTLLFEGMNLTARQKPATPASAASGVGPIAQTPRGMATADVKPLKVRRKKTEGAAPLTARGPATDNSMSWLGTTAPAFAPTAPAFGFTTAPATTNTNGNAFGFDGMTLRQPTTTATQAAPKPAPKPTTTIDDLLDFLS